MAEVQTQDQSGEMTSRFIQFIMLQAQQTKLCLGILPHPATGKPEPNMAAAKMFVEHLEMIEAKTRGNLSQEETQILSNALTELHIAHTRIQAG